MNADQRHRLEHAEAQLRSPPPRHSFSADQAAIDRRLSEIDAEIRARMDPNNAEWGRWRLGGRLRWLPRGMGLPCRQFGGPVGG